MASRPVVEVRQEIDGTSHFSAGFFEIPLRKTSTRQVCAPQGAKSNFHCRARPIILLLAIGYLLFAAPLALAETPQDIQDAIERRQRQIAEIEAQISEYWKEVDERKAQGESVKDEIEVLKSKIAKSELEIRSLKFAIEESEYKLRQTESELNSTVEHLEKTRERVAFSLRMIRQKEEMPILLRFAEVRKLSDLFAVMGELEQFHGSLSRLLDQLKEEKAYLEDTKEAIEREKYEQEKLRQFEESQKAIAARQKNRQNSLLTQLEREQDKFIGAITEKKRDLDKIREQIEYLTSTGVSVEEAIRFGELAAIRTGVRTAFLIAVLEIESRLGLNVGTGNWRDDMHPRDQEAFLAITGKLGLDPDTTPVSKKPSYGWGGAMGPAQFLPNTWMAYEAEVANLTGHNPPNPWNIEDAFTAAALKLSRQGAAEGTREGERRAAKAYIGGSPNCSRSICNYYANLVLEKAEEIEQEL